MDQHVQCVNWLGPGIKKKLLEKNPRDTFACFLLSFIWVEEVSLYEASQGLLSFLLSEYGSLIWSTMLEVRVQGKLCEMVIAWKASERLKYPTENQETWG